MHALDAIAAIEAGPKGPDIGAFFDFDGTLIDGYSAVAYFTDRLRRREMSLGEAADVIRVAWRGDMDEIEFADVIRKAVAEWAGHPEEELAELWSRLFKERIASQLFPEGWSLVKAHQKMGHTVAIASSATRYQTAPIAEELGIEHLLCTRATVRNGRLTGGVEGAPLWGAGKADAVRDFARTHKIALSRSHGYANGNEDVAFLRTVGHATAVNPKPALVEAAQREGWTVLRFPARRNASAAILARSLGAYSTLAAMSLCGLAYAMTTGKRRRAAEWVSATSSDAMLAITGIDVEVQGEHHLWAHRPSVFLFNHQSMVDGYVLLRLLRRGFTGVAKKEVAKMPLLGQILRALDFAFIDRGNARNAKEAMQPAVDRLRLGMSIVIAPEGTRGLTPRLGRFKKGAFHIAMQAGAPVVPVVIRNTYEVMTRGSLLFRPGTVQVCVLPPIDVTQWKVEDLDRHVADARALFERTLDDWPAAGRG
ncbi:MAG TPA: HAD-IB family hydrolase [Xanthobacteraceae bacterium]|jgi:putative phosphoserine phosphatase/1-acylglycerol-3-phosphate O-acyltransferase